MNYNTQLEEGEYDDLFLQSDAMIHDSGSFLAEYLYTQKPVLFLMKDKSESNLNEFGLKALEACFKANSQIEIEEFIKSVLNEELDMSSVHQNFYDSEINQYFKDGYPSEKIVQIIKQGLGSQ